MGLADLHIHSIFSYDGTCSISAILKYVADFTDLTTIAITDHDTVNGVQEALDLAPAYGIGVVPGCEISTSDGHLLALFIDRPVRAGLSLVQTVLRVGELGGICIAAHPMARGTSSLSIETIRQALQFPQVARILIGIEAFNGGLVYTHRNPMVAALAQTLPLSQIGNSDSHILQTIGQGATHFSGRTTGELRRALETKSTRVRKGEGLTGVSVLQAYIPRYLMRKLGWTVWNANRDAPMTYVRLSRLMINCQPVLAN